MKKLIISTCGTSIFTAESSSEERKLLTDYANAGKESDIAPAHLPILQARITFCQNELAAQKNIDELAKISAELNGLRGCYGGTISGNDHHILLATDTWLGEQSAKAIEAVLRHHGQSTEIKRQTDLRTDDLSAYRMALSELVKWAYDVLPNYRSQGYRIIFNLTGGFKAVQGFMQTLGMLHADECVYVYEGSSVIRLPRLPIKMDARSDIEKYLTAFRRMAEMGLEVSSEDVHGVSESFLMTIDNKSTLSEWGQMVWQETKDALYEERLHLSPSKKLKFGKNFESSLNGLEKKRLREVNAKIDALARYIETNQSLLSLDFKPIKGKLGLYEADAWHDGDAKRLYGYYEGDVFVVDNLGKALH